MSASGLQMIRLIDAGELDRWFNEKDPKHWKDLYVEETEENLKKLCYSRQLIATCLKFALRQFVDGSEKIDEIFASKYVVGLRSGDIRGIKRVYKACVYLTGVTSMKDIMYCAYSKYEYIGPARLELVAEYLSEE